jgi:hypothetical protein
MFFSFLLHATAAAAVSSGGASVCVNPVPGQDMYSHLEKLLGAGAVESPSDAAYTPARPHILPVADDGIVGPHYAVIAIEPTDVNLDRVPHSAGGDRSRTEIKLAPSKGAHDVLKAREGDTFTYTWRFRIAADMRFSPSFTHLHQIKAYGGPYAEPPLITFTALAGGQMEVRHVADRLKEAKHTVLGAMPLAGNQGRWLVASETITYSSTQGRYLLAVRDMQGGEVLAIDQGGLQTWRSGAEHMRPKWGIYRKHHADLNQHRADTLYLSNLCLVREAAHAD